MALSRKTKIFGLIGLGVLVTLVIVVSVLATRTDTPEVTVVKLETRKELRSTVTSSGEVRPIQFMNLTSEVQGRIEEIYVKEGDHVTKGQPLVRLDPNQLQSSTDAQSRCSADGTGRHAGDYRARSRLPRISTPRLSRG